MCDNSKKVRIFAGRIKQNPINNNKNNEKYQS